MNTAADWAFDAVIVGCLTVLITGTWWLSGRRSGLQLASWIYGAAVLVFTLLPLPSEPALWCEHHWEWSNAIPGRSFIGIVEFFEEGRPWRGVIYAVQVVLNVVMFMPLGALLDARFAGHERVRRDLVVGRASNEDGLGTGRIMSSAGRRVTLLVWTMIGLGVSCLIEFTQWTGLYGLIPCSYRIVDVDDLITNTLGTALGVIALRAWRKRTGRIGPPSAENA